VLALLFLPWDKAFFFEKKKQKTFIPSPLERSFLYKGSLEAA
jgi:hypothetical protein